jgi:hypothetical protein
MRALSARPTISYGFEIEPDRQGADALYANVEFNPGFSTV